MSKYSGFLELTDDEISFMDTYYSDINLDDDDLSIAKEYNDDEQLIEMIDVLFKNARLEYLKALKIHEIKATGISGLLEYYGVHNYYSSSPYNSWIDMCSLNERGTYTYTSIRIDDKVDNEDFEKFIRENSENIDIYKISKYLDKYSHYSGYSHPELDVKVYFIDTLLLTSDRNTFGNSAFSKDIKYITANRDILIPRSVSLSCYPNLTEISDNITFEDSTASLAGTNVKKESSGLYSVVEKLFDLLSDNDKGIYSFYLLNDHIIADYCSYSSNDAKKTFTHNGITYTEYENGGIGWTKATCGEPVKLAQDIADELESISDEIVATESNGKTIVAYKGIDLKIKPSLSNMKISYSMDFDNKPSIEIRKELRELIKTAISNLEKVYKTYDLGVLLDKANVRYTYDEYETPEGYLQKAYNIGNI